MREETKSENHNSRMENMHRENEYTFITEVQEEIKRICEKNNVDWFVLWKSKNYFIPKIIVDEMNIYYKGLNSQRGCINRAAERIIQS